MASNHIQRFIFKEHGIRGQFIQLNDAWQSMTLDRHYPEVISNLLGELSIIAVIMANGLKHKGKVTLQVQGSGPVNLLVVEVTNDLQLRGVAKTTQTITDQQGLNELLGDGQILATLENTQTHHHFQSYVPRTADSIASCFEEFFQQSEQLDTRLWLTANEQQAAGLVIQKMPGESHARETEEDTDAWNRIEHLCETVKDEELTQLAAEELLHRLFHEEVVEIYQPSQVEYHCPHDQSKVDNMLISLGEEEVRRLLAEQGEIIIHNEICNFHARYDEAAIDALFSSVNSEDKIEQNNKTFQ